MYARVVSRSRVLPDAHHVLPEPRHTPLSTLDATVARFSPTSALWLFDSPAEPRARAALSTDQLALSLQKTLNAYPQWAGQLGRAPFQADGSGDHTQRYGRLSLTYGSADDPGVELVVAHFPGAVARLAPSASERASFPGGWWDASQLPSAELLCPDVPLALHDMSAADWAGLPCMLVQMTTFDCGGLAVGLRFPHPLADAQTLLRFVHDWAAVNRAMAAHDGAPLPELAPVFDPQMLDRAAAGDIDAARPDPALISTARALPLHRYDWWASARGCPAFLADAARVPAELDPAAVGPLGVPIPWAEWDLAADVAHHVLFFGADEVHRMWEAASATAATSSSSSVRVSHLDALLSHVWALIIRARGLGSDEEAHLDVTLGLRPRLATPLPDAFLGSPIVVGRVTATGDQAAATQDSGLGAMAAAIRTTLEQFNAATLPALLHEVAHEAGAQRMWHAFLGRRHTIVTSWLRLNVYGVDFVGGDGDEGAPPRYVEAVMPTVDGCVQVMEAGHSSAAGTSVSLHLAAEVMHKLLHDPLLRKFAPPQQ